MNDIPLPAVPAGRRDPSRRLARLVRRMCWRARLTPHPWPRPVEVVVALAVIAAGVWRVAPHTPHRVGYQVFAVVLMGYGWLSMRVLIRRAVSEGGPELTARLHALVNPPAGERAATFDAAVDAYFALAAHAALQPHARSLFDARPGWEAVQHLASRAAIVDGQLSDRSLARRGLDRAGLRSLLHRASDPRVATVFLVRYGSVERGTGDPFDAVIAALTWTLAFVDGLGDRPGALEVFDTLVADHGPGTTVERLEMFAAAARLVTGETPTIR